MTAQAKVTIYRNEIWTSTPFLPAFVEELKAAIPGRRRKWDAAQKLWCINREFGAVVEYLLQRHYGSFVYVAPADLGLGLDVGHRGFGDADAFAALHLLPSAPPELIDSAHRILSKLHHPDRGGDHEAMVRINVAYGVLSKVE